MTGVHLVPGVDDADHWSAFEFVKLQSHLFHTGTVSERPQVIRTKPAHAAQLFCSYFFNGHGFREK